MRTEPCVCGGLIAAPDLASSAPYVEAHGLLPGHQAWRAVKEGWHVIPDERFDDPRRERPTASLSRSSGPVGSVQGPASVAGGASTAPVRGRS